MQIEIIHGDALEFVCDVLVLKHAQALYGVDSLVVHHLETAGSSIRDKLPKPYGFEIFLTRQALGAARVLFVGVPELRQFDYEAIRIFARRALMALAEALPATKHLAITLHGPGYGLDETEAFKAEIAGLLDATTLPLSLETITFVEHNEGRARRLADQLFALGFRTAPTPTDIEGQTSKSHIDVEALESAGALSKNKAHVFVAMPFASEFDDRFHYGIQRAVHASGRLCERADLASFTGDVVTWVKDRIASASLVVADLTTASPNVYLEVGYAWGRGVPTVLIANESSDLRFDVRSQRCLIYKGSIKRLEELLTTELQALIA